jgi:hypothetical protein
MDLALKGDRIFKTCLNGKKSGLKNDTKLNSESKCSKQISFFFTPQIWRFFSENTKNFLFSHFGTMKKHFCQ